MTTQPDISEDEPVTLINIFEIPVDDVDSFIADWTRRARIMSRYPGFQDTRLHRALTPDGRFQLVNVAHWASLEAYRTAQTDPEFQAGIRRVAGEASVR
ncbi:MAG: antibiotic biosynthesis monooxygenase, partial [Microlunatus sp.]|nr:antibiotic biosynthesis monooxygenase [Microlunatus sp.]